MKIEALDANGEVVAHGYIRRWTFDRTHKVFTNTQDVRIVTEENFVTQLRLVDDITIDVDAGLIAYPGTIIIPALSIRVHYTNIEIVT